jgi:hypothetical protein
MLNTAQFQYLAKRQISSGLASDGWRNIAVALTTAQVVRSPVAVYDRLSSETAWRFG